MPGPAQSVPDVRSHNMRSVRSKDTRPELKVRSMLHKLGYRYRLHRADLPGRPDIVFPSRRKVVEVRGCFWHQHQDPACRKNKHPKTREAWWKSKLDRNLLRDAANEQQLEEMGWQVCIIWECELKALAEVRERLIKFLGATGKPARISTNRNRTLPSTRMNC